MAGQAAFLAQSAAAFARSLSLPPSQVYAMNVTDVATGVAVQVGSLRRVLGGPGSMGVAITFVARLGKTPTQKDVLNISQTLNSPALMKGPLDATTASFATASGVDVRALSAAVPAASVSVANAPFSLSVGGGASSSSSGTSSGTLTGGIVGGIVGAIGLACAVWGVRSFSKHGQCPCCRDRKRELVYRREEKADAELVASAIAEAQAALEAPEAAAAPAAARPSKPKGDKVCCALAHLRARARGA